MQDSQNKAIAVAFLKAGLPVSIEDNGVMIAEVLKNSAAVGKLQRGDLIIAVDGKRWAGTGSCGTYPAAGNW